MFGFSKKKAEITLPSYDDLTTDKFIRENSPLASGYSFIADRLFPGLDILIYEMLFADHFNDWSYFIASYKNVPPAKEWERCKTKKDTILFQKRICDTITAEVSYTAPSSSYDESFDLKIVCTENHLIIRVLHFPSWDEMISLVSVMVAKTVLNRDEKEQAERSAVERIYRCMPEVREAGKKPLTVARKT